MKNPQKKFFGIKKSILPQKKEQGGAQTKPSSGRKGVLNDLAFRVYGERILLCFVIGILLMTSFQIGNMVWSEFQELQSLGRKRVTLLAEMKYWQNITEKYPQYRDGYLELAMISYQVGERDQARTYLDKVLMLDPNSIQGIRVKQEMGL